MTANCALFKPIGRTLDPTIIIGQHTPTVKPFTSLNLTLSQIPLFKTKNMGVNPQVNLTHPMLALSGANPFNTISILIHLVSVPFCSSIFLVSVPFHFNSNAQCGDSTTVLKLNPLLGFRYLLLLHCCYRQYCCW